MKINIRGFRISKIVKLCALFVLIFFLHGQIFTLIKTVDKKFLQNNIENLLGIILNENWDIKYPEILETETFPKGTLIAHAVGFRGTKLENTLEGLSLSRRNGLTTFEVDIILDQQEMYCSHEMAATYDCKFNEILIDLKPNEQILLDIKSDFREALAFLKKNQFFLEKRTQIIFQIYLPSQIKLMTDFFGYNQKHVFTLYRSHRSLKHICRNLDANKIANVVISESKLEDFKKHCNVTKPIVHPITNCAQLAKLTYSRNISVFLVSKKAIFCQNQN